MSDTKNLANRIPFESIETLHNWSLPSLGDDIQPVPSAQRQARRQQELEAVISRFPTPSHAGRISEPCAAALTLPDADELDLACRGR